MTHTTEAIYEGVLKASRNGEPVALVTLVDAPGSAPRAPGAKMLVCADGRTLGSVGGGPAEAWVTQQARDALREERSRLVGALPEQGRDACGDSMQFFVDVILPCPTLLIIGAGHIGQALASLGSWLGYRIAVLDERAALADSDHFPDADTLLCGSLDEHLRTLQLTETTYAVIVTPHHSADEEALAVLALHEVAYVGLLGSDRRTDATFRRARAAGVPDAFLQRVHTPVGMDIHAETPREIAVSILAEMTAVRRG